MAEAMVGGAFLSASLQVLFDRIASRQVVNFLRGKGLADKLLKKLKIQLLTADSVLDDAEEKQVSSLSVKKWVDELKDAVYVAEDLLDEIHTRASRCNLECEYQISTSQVQSLISSSFDAFDQKEIESKLEDVLETLEFVVKQKDVLGLKQVCGAKLSRRLPTTCLVDETAVYGRDDDRESIISFLASDNASGDGIGVIPIVGLGGIGKTTLAQLVYNDSRVNELFDIKVWVFVSEDFDVCRVSKTILESITCSNSNIGDLNLLQLSLKRELIGKKFLIVLDDVWNENYLDWEMLCGPFKFGAEGSKIIVTTRSDEVAAVTHTVSTHYLKHLTEPDCWSLFAKHAFGNLSISRNPDLELIGKKIAMRCRGLPLAAKALGGLLRSERDVTKWETILKSNLWDLPDGEKKILPALRLSYYYLSSKLKQCFAYCAIFPKGYQFEVEKLVQLWMTEDLFQQSTRLKRMEDVGVEYFFELVSRSFFQRSSAKRSHFFMHDLVNDLAKSVSRDFCFGLEAGMSPEISSKARYLALNKTDFVPSKFKVFSKAKDLRTFLFLEDPQICYMFPNILLNDVIPNLRSLRALSLPNYINLRVLPTSVSKLSLLRYLNLSCSSIEVLPNFICDLSNLQTLILSQCHCLTSLPSNMERLIKLRHLDIRETYLIEMPSGLGRLKDLQTLTDFVIGHDSGSSIGELKELQSLHGVLKISGLHFVGRVSDALKANLKGKEYLDKLGLAWNGVTSDSRKEKHMLEMLEPHTNLKELIIRNYAGTSFPNWIGDLSFSNMVGVHLEYCRYCFFLPPLVQLSSLKELSVVGFEAVLTVGAEFHGDAASSMKPFKSLKILKFKQMLEWMEWVSFEGENEAEGLFPCLQELYLQHCPKLTGSLPKHLPCLTKLYIVECPQLVASIPRAGGLCDLELADCSKVLLKTNNDLTSHPSLHVPELPSNELPPTLKRLSMACFFNLQTFPQLTVGSNTSLQKLTISGCVSLTSFPWGSLPTTLRELSFVFCPKLDFSVDHNFPSLMTLSVEHSLDSLKLLPLHIFPVLQNLKLSMCRNLESLSVPDGPSHLQSLAIFGCSNLEFFPDGSLLPNLTFLDIGSCAKLLTRRLDWGLHRLPNLKRFSITDGNDMQIFQEEFLLPPTLTCVGILDLQNLRSLNNLGLRHLTSLKQLFICNCPELQFISMEKLPASLLTLEIEHCDLLAPQIQRKEGNNWSKIAHIPYIKIDDYVIA